MKIKHIETIPLVRKLQDVFQGGTYKITSRNTIVTRITLEDGTLGHIPDEWVNQYSVMLRTGKEENGVLKVSKVLCFS